MQMNFRAITLKFPVFVSLPRHLFMHTKDERLSWRGAVLVHKIAQDRAATLTTETLKMNWQWVSRIEAMGVGAGNELRWAPVMNRIGRR